MAEPFSIAVAALELAGIGVKLARSLKEYLDSVRTVDQNIGKVADQVQATSTTLEQVATLFSDQSFRGIYKQELLDGTEQTLAGCRRAFVDLEKFVTKSLRRGNDGKVVVSVATRLTFYFKEKQLDALQARLERFVSSLGIIMGVLNLALSIKTAEDTNFIELQRQEIKILQNIVSAAQSNEVSMQRQIEDLLMQMRQGTHFRQCVAEGSRCMMKQPPCVRCQQRGLVDECERPVTQADAEMAGATPSLPSTATSLSLHTAGSRTLNDIVATSAVVDQRLTSKGDERDALTALHACATAATALSSDIQSFLAHKRTTDNYQRHCLAKALAATNQAMDALSAFQNQDDDDEDVTFPNYDSGHLPVSNSAYSTSTNPVGDDDEAPEISITHDATHSDSPLPTPMIPQADDLAEIERLTPLDPSGLRRTALTEDEDSVTLLSHFQEIYDELFKDDMEHDSTQEQTLGVDELLHQWTTLGAKD